MPKDAKKFSNKAPYLRHHISATRKWRLDRFDDEEVERSNQNALKSDVSGFVECVSRMEHAGSTGMELANVCGKE